MYCICRTFKLFIKENKMKIYIFADMEGISGISDAAYVLPGEAKYAYGCKYLTREINICAAACLEAGADEVIVRDGHYMGNSIIWENLIPGVQLVHGAEHAVRYPGIDGCDAVILLGYHAMAGTRNALLEHTYSSKIIQNVWLNGDIVGEFAVDTLIAGEKGLPVIMTSGCDKLCAEAKAFSPDVITCQVKKSISLNGAILLSPADAEKLLHDKTIEAINAFKAGKIKPLTASPVTLRAEFVERMEPGRADFIAPRTVEVSADKVEEALYKVF